MKYHIFELETGWDLRADVTHIAVSEEEVER